VFRKRVRISKQLIARCQAVNKLDYGGYAQKGDQPKCRYSEGKNCSFYVACGFALQQHVRAIKLDKQKNCILNFCTILVNSLAIKSVNEALLPIIEKARFQQRELNDVAGEGGEGKKWSPHLEVTRDFGMVQVRALPKRNAEPGLSLCEAFDEALVLDKLLVTFNLFSFFSH